MLFMIIERFRNGDHRAVGERFRACGRMASEGVVYIASWVDPAGALCFQVMESPDRALLDVWMSRWSDLVDFEVFPVQTSVEFWAGVGGTSGG